MAFETQPLAFGSPTVRSARISAAAPDRVMIAHCKVAACGAATVLAVGADLRRYLAGVSLDRLEDQLRSPAAAAPAGWSSDRSRPRPRQAAAGCTFFSCRRPSCPNTGRSIPNASRSLTVRGAHAPPGSLCGRGAAAGPGYGSSLHTCPPSTKGRLVRDGTRPEPRVDGPTAGSKTGLGPLNGRADRRRRTRPGPDWGLARAGSMRWRRPRPSWPAVRCRPRRSGQPIECSSAGRQPPNPAVGPARRAKAMLSRAMVLYTFRLDPTKPDSLERQRQLDGDAEAHAYARQLLKDWPDIQAVDVLRDGALLNRLRRPPA